MFSYGSHGRDRTGRGVDAMIYGQRLEGRWQKSGPRFSIT